MTRNEDFMNFQKFPLGIDSYKYERNFKQKYHLELLGIEAYIIW